MKKFLSLVVLLSGVAGFLVGTVAAKPSLPSIDAVDGVKTISYGDVVTLSDGKTYRVTSTIVRKAGEKDYIVADMFSLDSEFAEVRITRSADGKSLGRRYACTVDAFKVRGTGQCIYNPAASALLEEAIQKVTVPHNLIGNVELLWSWELGTKELRQQIAAK